MKNMGRSLVIMLACTVYGTIGAEPSSAQAKNTKTVMQKPTSSELREQDVPQEDNRGFLAKTWDSTVEFTQGVWDTVTGWFRKDAEKSPKSSRARD